MDYHTNYHACERTCVILRRDLQQADWIGNKDLPIDPLIEQLAIQNASYATHLEASDMASITGRTCEDKSLLHHCVLSQCDDLGKCD